ncbi:MAG: DUF5069 domain-containing protein [Verrucomicrobiota bacterium]
MKIPSSYFSGLLALLWISSHRLLRFKNKILEGGSDEEILEWCFQRGRALNETDLLIWNAFARKLGWNDRATPLLEKCKSESKLASHTELVTIFDYMEMDEGRKHR